MGPVIVVFGLLGLLALWTAINPRSVYWALTAWQYKDPEANEPSDAAYTMSRVGAVVTLAILVGFGFQAAGWDAEQRDREDCKTVLLPALRQTLRDKPVTRKALEDFAGAHGLTLKVTTIRVPTYRAPQRTATPRATASPSATASGTPTKRPTPAATPTPSPSRTAAPSPSRTATPRPTETGGTTTTAVTAYNFQRNGRTVLTWTDGSAYWGQNPTCKV